MRALARRLFKLFVDKPALAVLTLGWTALCALGVQGRLPPAWIACALPAGLATILAASIATARRKP